MSMHILCIRNLITFYNSEYLRINDIILSDLSLTCVNGHDRVCSMEVRDIKLKENSVSIHKKIWLLLR